MYRDLIAVTNRHLCSCPFTEQITRVCKLHPNALILREKDLPEEEYFSLARQAMMPGEHSALSAKSNNSFRE